jgi:prevent-host-death family protein
MVSTLRSKMDRVQQIVPISDMKLKHAAVLSLLKKGPVVLAQRSKPAAVLVSVAQWDRMADEIEELRDQIDILAAKLEFSQSGEQLEEFDSDEFPNLADVQTSPLPRRQKAIAESA